MAIKNSASAPASQIYISISKLSAAQMPSYDPIAHYVGLTSGQPHSASIWLLESASQPDMGPALFGALALACMDTGFAGAKWKAIYDTVAAADAALPSTVVDRYRNRHLLLQKIQAVLKRAVRTHSSSS
jgi:hypothetical protein